jgi:hypothetical protein
LAVLLYVKAINNRMQKHTQTKEKQLQMWVNLALNYCKENKIFKMTKSNFLNTLGVNKTMKRKLNIDSVNVIFDYALEKSINLNNKRLFQTN